MGAMTLASGRLIGVMLATACLAGLTACGSGEPQAKASPGTPENPLPATPSSLEGATSETAAKPVEPNFKSLVEQQQGVPARQERDNPCALVTKAQAQTILGGRLLDPVVAPQGPTCIYRSRSGERFATIAIQAQRFDDVRAQIRRIERVEVSDHTAYCGMHGQPVLYLPLSGSRLLSVAAPCETAARFARRAAPQLLR